MKFGGNSGGVLGKTWREDGGNDLDTNTLYACINIKYLYIKNLF